MVRSIKSDNGNVSLVPVTGITEVVGIAGQQGAMDLYERTGSGTNKLRIQAPATMSADMTITAPGIGDETSLTIATGAITVTTGFHRVDTEASAASDDLDTINGGYVGMLLVLKANNSSRDVVLKDGTGNLKLAGDFTLNNVEDTITLIWSTAASAWQEICRSDNGA